MSEYVPAREVRRLAHSAESFAGIFPDDSEAQRLGNKLAEEARECLEEHAVSESDLQNE